MIGSKFIVFIWLSMVLNPSNENSAKSLESYIATKANISLTATPDKIHSLAVEHVFQSTFYDVYANMKTDESSYPEIVRLAASYTEGTWILFPKLEDETNLTTLLSGLYQKHFKLTNETEAYILLEALKDAFSISAINPEVRPNYSKVEQMGNVWTLKVAGFFEEFQYFKIVTKADGRIVKVTYHLS